ncbi:MAG: ACP S-malonyltransferase [Alphaproteobacteria bacterium]|nr:ACP S-malonyltransferase [Alphaproteobacteria bacterium]
MIFVFPGQGSQKIGMGKDIYDNFSSARDVFHEVDDAISFSLSRLIFEGTEEELKKTENTQPALMTVSMAFVEVMKKEFGVNLPEKAKFFAGHSLGEYTALCAADAISLIDAARILRVRGKAMAEACPTGGAMAAILGLDINQVEQIVEEACGDSSPGSVKVQVANDNSVGQVVISGHEEAVRKSIEIAQSRGAKRAVVLPVSGPFHSELMQPAAEILKEVLCDVEFKTPSKPIIANVTAKAETENFKELLLKQITGRVRWVESIRYAESQGVSKCVEVGAGKVLTGLVKRISPSMQLVNINSVESFEQLKEM